MNNFFPLIFLFLMFSVEVLAKELFPYKLTSGDEVIIEVNKDGKVVHGNGRAFCKKLTKVNANDIQSFNERFNESIKNANHLNMYCLNYIKVVEENSQHLKYYCSLSINNNVAKEICKDFKAPFFKSIERLDYLSNIYLSITNNELNLAIKNEKKRNSIMLESVRKRRDELLALCEDKYNDVLNNDKSGIEEINFHVKSINDLESLRALRDFKFLSLDLPESCKFQERYKRLINEIGLAKENLTSAIQGMEEKNSDIYILRTSSTQSLDKYTDQMASYAALIGRATACGVDPEKELEKIGLWMDDWFALLNVEERKRSMYILTFMEGAQFHTKQQMAGTSPDSCESAISAYNSARWP